MPGRPRHVGSSELARGSSRGGRALLHNALHSGVGDKTCVCVCLRVAVAVNRRPASPSLSVRLPARKRRRRRPLGPAAGCPRASPGRSARRRQCDPRPSERFPGQKSSPYLDAPPQPQLGTSYVRGVSICACLGWSYHGYWYFHKLA